MRNSKHRATLVGTEAQRLGKLVVYWHLRRSGGRLLVDHITAPLDSQERGDQYPWHEQAIRR
jgi:hypothetical protein